MLVASLLFGISASLDALLVGIGFGIRKVRIRLWQNLVISLITLLGTCLSVGLGNRLASFLPRMVSAYAGSLILVVLGLYYIGKWIIVLFRSRAAGKRGRPETLAEDQDLEGSGQPSSLRPAEVFTLSLTLSLNNLSAGLSASLAGLTLVPTAIATFACSVSFLSAGNRLGGCHALQLAGCLAEPLSGLLLIGLGLVQLFW